MCSWTFLHLTHQYWLYIFYQRHGPTYRQVTTSGYHLYQRPLQLSPTIHCNHYMAYQQRTTWWPRTTKGLHSNFPTISNSKNPNHHFNVPHKVEEVYEAAWFVLQGYTSFTQNLIASNSSQQLQQPQPPSNSPVDSTNTPVKTKYLSTLFTGFTKSIIEALQSTQHRGQPCANHSHEGKLECNYCGEEHFISDCPHIPHDIAAGKCKRNQDGKVLIM